MLNHTHLARGLALAAAPALQARSWVLVDFPAGQVLAGSNADLRVEPASLTKLMTAYIIRRLLFMVPTLFGIMLVSFVVVQFAPGGPVERIIAQLSGADTGARAGRRPARMVLRVPRVARRRERQVEARTADGELVRRELAHHDGAGAEVKTVRVDAEADHAA